MLYFMYREGKLQCLRTVLTHIRAEPLNMFHVPKERVWIVQDHDVSAYIDPVSVKYSIRHGEI